MPNSGYDAMSLDDGDTAMMISPLEQSPWDEQSVVIDGDFSDFGDDPFEETDQKAHEMWARTEAGFSQKPLNTFTSSHAREISERSLQNRVKSPTCDQSFLGAVSQAAQIILAKAGEVGADSRVPLAKQVQSYVYERRSRENYVLAADRYLKTKIIDLDECYDVIVVGAGIHAATFVYSVKKNCPHLKVLIVEKSDSICSTFCRLGDSLVLNSPTFSKVDLNANFFPGHFIQLSDFDELAQRAFPTAKHLYELATMMLFHADADILFNFQVHDLDKGDGKYIVSSNGQDLHARSVVLANGMGAQKKDAFTRDVFSPRVMDGDDFISSCHEDKAFLESIRKKKLAVVGAGDTANCVMEYLLPLTYPNNHYESFSKGPFLPSLLYWIGQSAESVQEFYFANKKRYCHSGGIIEFFWDGDTPFDLPTESWVKTKSLIRCIPDKLLSLTHLGDSLELRAGSQIFSADFVIDCTGRFNALSHQLLKRDYEFVEGDLRFAGGGWDESADAFSALSRIVPHQRIACRLKGEHIFMIGCAAPLQEMVDDAEARDGSLRYQEEQQSITNSKISLEHTLPRSFAFASLFPDFLA